MSAVATTVPLCVADIEEEDVTRVAEVVRSGWLTHGPYNAELEEGFQRYFGVGHAIAMNSCASALHLALVASGVRGEVILPSFTFMASANAVVTAGATPVYADIEPVTRNLDPAAVEAAITPRTEAIMPVHYAGHACDMEAIMAIAERHDLVVVEDSAETIGGEVAGRKAGTFGIGTFSFYPTKNMTTGEGGLLTTDDDDVASAVRTLMGHGVASKTMDRDRAARPWVRSAILPGYNFRMSNVLAALGVGQLARLDEMNDRRREHAAWYGEHLAGFDALELPVEMPGYRHVWQMYTVRLRRGDRDVFVEELRRRGVGASVHFDPPVHRQPYYEELLGGTRPELPVTEDVVRTICTLPMFPTMTEGQLTQVRDGVEAALVAAGA